MARPKRKCSVEGCDGAHVGRGYCMRHYQQLRYHGKLQPLQPKHTRIYGEQEVRDLSTYVMQSQCCSKEVREGRQHAYGKQYCTACGDPCLWRYVHKRDIQSA